MHKCQLFLSGDLGGFLGLLVGGSVLTTAEILDLIIYNTMLKLFRKNANKYPQPTAV